MVKKLKEKAKDLEEKLTEKEKELQEYREKVKVMESLVEKIKDEVQRSNQAFYDATRNRKTNPKSQRKIGLHGKKTRESEEKQKGKQPNIRRNTGRNTAPH